jgi:hypothetical protein
MDALRTNMRLARLAGALLAALLAATAVGLLLPAAVAAAVAAPADPPWLRPAAVAASAALAGGALTVAAGLSVALALRAWPARIDVAAGELRFTPPHAAWWGPPPPPTAVPLRAVAAVEVRPLGFWAPGFAWLELWDGDGRASPPRRVARVLFLGVPEAARAAGRVRAAAAHAREEEAASAGL